MKVNQVYRGYRIVRISSGTHEGRHGTFAHTNNGVTFFSDNQNGIWEEI